jgi:hypothetical protein
VTNPSPTLPLLVGSSSGWTSRSSVPVDLGIPRYAFSDLAPRALFPHVWKVSPHLDDC